jgi:predicted dehydrogenase
MLKLGVVGVGYLGRFHAEKLAAIPGVELVGVADIKPERADEVASRFGVKSFYDYRDMLGKIDAVSIAVPTKDHFLVASLFLSEGVHVMLEKPITRTLEEADALIALNEGNGTILQVGHLERFNPAMLAAMPYTGTPLFIEATRINLFPDRGTDVDVVLDLMIHDIDITLSLVGAMPSSVQAIGVPVVTEQVDIANARLEFENGCVANLTASRISNKSLRKIRVFQKDAYLSIDYGERQVNVIRREKPDSSSRPETVVEDLKVGPGDSLEAELKAFAHAINTKSNPLVSGADGRKALAVAAEIMAEINARTKKWPEFLTE